MPEGGDFASFFSTRGQELCTLKLSPGRNFDGKKLVARQSVEGGMVTGQIDTCVMMWLQKHNSVYINPNNCKYI